MHHRFFSRTGLALWVAATLGAICVIPYALALAPQALEDAVQQTDLPIALLLTISIFQSALLLGLMTFSGLWAAKRLGLGAPLVDSWVAGAPPFQNLKQSVGQSIVLGLIGAIAIIALEHWVFIPLDAGGLGTVAQEHPPAWMGLLASFYGGIAEEVQLRLFLFSFLALGVKYLTDRFNSMKQEKLGSRSFWVTNVVVAIVFGLAHLPATAELIAITPLIVVRAIALNGVIGIMAGYLYWKRGIEMAIVCHFSADIVLHVLSPLALN